MSTRKPIKVLIPWSFSMYGALNGVHPFSRSWVENNSFRNIELVYPEKRRPSFRNRLSLLIQNYRLSQSIVGHHKPNFKLLRWMQRFFASRKMREQLQIETYKNEVDFVFHHTVPLNQNSLPWIMHFESPTTLFLPQIEHGQTATMKLEETLAYHVIKRQIQSEKCLAVFSHIKENVEIVKKIFNDPIISSKIHYVPAGIPDPHSFRQEIQDKISRDYKKQPITFLFTNSFNGHPDNFCLRGGLDVLAALGQLEKLHPNIKIKIVSSQPSIVPSKPMEGLETKAFKDFVPHNIVEKIEWIPTGITDEEMNRLFVESDFFLLPSAGLHSMSTMKALSFGCIVAVSDAPGLEEFITDNVNGIRITGRKNLVYSADPVTGWYRDKYHEMYRVQPSIVNQLHDRIRFLIENPEERKKLLLNSFQNLKQERSIFLWCERFSEVVHKCQGLTFSEDLKSIATEPNWNTISFKDRWYDRPLKSTLITSLFFVFQLFALSKGRHN